MVQAKGIFLEIHISTWIYLDQAAMIEKKSRAPSAFNPKMTPRTVTLTVQAQATFQDSEKTQYNKETCSNEVTPGDLRTHRHCLYEFRNNVKTRAPLEIRQLNADLLDIDSQFQQISTELLKFDAEAFVDNKQEALELHPTWKSHHEKFKEILKNSRDTASRACAVMKLYNDAILASICTENICDIQKELKRFMELVAKEKRYASATQRSFKLLAEQLRLFAAVIDITLSRAEQTPMEANNRAMGTEFLKELVAGASSVALTLYTLCPRSVGEALGKINKLEGGKYLLGTQEQEALRKEIAQCEHGIAALEAKDARLKAYKSSLKGTQNEVRAIASKVDVISSIWVSLAADMENLHCQLKIATNIEPTSLFHKKVASARELFLNLSAALEEYGRGTLPAEHGCAKPVECDIDDAAGSATCRNPCNSQAPATGCVPVHGTAQVCVRSVRVDDKPSCGARPVNKITKNVGKEVHCERNGSASDGRIVPGVERINCWQRICRATCGKAKTPDESKQPCEYLKADGTTLINTGKGNCGGRDKRGNGRVDKVAQGDCDDGEIDRIVKTTVKTTETIFKTRGRHHNEVVGKDEGVTCNANGGNVRWAFDCKA
ncbi:hypothetical protein VTO73DRAFT_10456 [Trametes versicolor]